MMLGWKIVLLPERPRHREPFIGEMWPAEEMRSGDKAGFYQRNELSARYDADWRALRAPLVVRLPNGYDFPVDSAYKPLRDGRDGWRVTGAAPLITLHPSLNFPDYHGLLQNGVISLDLEGRSYPGPCGGQPWIGAGVRLVVQVAGEEVILTGSPSEQLAAVRSRALAVVGYARERPAKDWELRDATGVLLTDLVQPVGGVLASSRSSRLVLSLPVGSGG